MIGLREKVKKGLMTPDEALDVINRSDEFESPNIRDWLKRRKKMKVAPVVEETDETITEERPQKRQRRRRRE